MGRDSVLMSQCESPDIFVAHFEPRIAGEGRETQRQWKAIPKIEKLFVNQQPGNGSRT